MNRHEYTHLHQLLNDLGIVFLIGLLNGFGWRSESNKNTLLREKQQEAYNKTLAQLKEKYC